MVFSPPRGAIRNLHINRNRIKLHEGSIMLRLASIFLLAFWISLSAVPAFAFLQDPSASCATCKGNFCPMKKAQEQSCHHSRERSDCKINAACNHSKDVVLFTFEGLLPDATIQYADASTMLLPNPTVPHLPAAGRVELPPPRYLHS